MRAEEPNNRRKTVNISKIEGIEQYDVIKMAAADEVERATSSGWKLLGVLTTSDDADTPFGRIRYETAPRFVLAKTSESLIATAVAEHDKVIQERDKAVATNRCFAEYLRTLRRQANDSTARIAKKWLIDSVDSALRAFDK